MSKTDPNIWWSARSLRKRTFGPKEYVGRNAAGGVTARVPVAYMLVDELSNQIVDEAANTIYGVVLEQPVI